MVGVVTGIGEAAALALRLVSGPLTDRTRKFWTWTIAGYALTVVTVPFLGVSSVLWIAATLVIAERVGKAVRSPAKDTLERYEHDDYTHGAAERPHKLSLPLPFWLYSGFTAITMIGFATFGVLSFHMVQRGVLPVPAVPIVYAAAMAADAVAALLSGWAYDRVGPKSLTALPIVGATVPMLAFTDSLPGIVLGALLWGAAVGIQLVALIASAPTLLRHTGQV
ncbi:Major facilitator superfamily [Mycobacteroides abscessus subsp. abscessus]|nr:Major facilitator superfamily [Mycobacteroides abscessus subsp. abscessus]